MAVTALWPVKSRLDKVITYVRNPEKVTEEFAAENAALHVISGVMEYAADEAKTERREYVSCLNCSEDTASKEFLEVKQFWRKTDGRLCYHGYQSFRPGEVDAQTAHDIGVELARRLWGDRFQVVVATHCNTGVYHTHFVINSVSFVDGYKFYESNGDYHQMRNMSDQLCREYGISVIENPQKRGKHYGQFAAEQHGKPTHSRMIRDDIDRAVAASQSPQAFFRLMREMGYNVTTHGKSGAPLKHPKLTPPDTAKNYRFDTLGEEYALERILERVRRNDCRRPLLDPPPGSSRTMKTTRMPTKKLTGIRALYFRYCYELGVIKKHPEHAKRVSYLLREDVIKLDRYIAEAKMLIAHRIETIDDLTAYRSELKQSIDRLTAERNERRNDLKRASRAQNEPEIAQIKAQIKAISEELNKMRKEVGYCVDIEERSARVQANLAALINNRENEVNHHEYPGRSGRSGR